MDFHDWMLEQHLTLAVAESVTVGRLASLCALHSGASAYFRGGVVAYSLEEKVKLLGVDAVTAKACNCVSSETALQMAEGVVALFGTDIGIATTGYAEPYPAEGIMNPFAWVAVKIQPLNRQWVERISFGSKQETRFKGLDDKDLQFPGVYRLATQKEFARRAFMYATDWLMKA